MFKKVGMVTVGVTAGLLAAAPLASAGEAPKDHDHDKDHKSSSHHEDRGGDCSVNGGEAEAGGGVEGDALLGNVVAQLPVGGNNIGNLTCNEVLNDNLSGNQVALDLL